MLPIGNRKDKLPNGNIVIIFQVIIAFSCYLTTNLIK